MARRMESKTDHERSVRIGGRPFTLRRSDVLRALRRAQPEPITSHFVVVGSQRFPPKQVISAVTGLDRADFTTHQARRTLMRLGFVAGRRGAGAAVIGAPGSAPGSSEVSPGGLSEQLRAHTGQWVAVRGEEILHAASSPASLVAWLSEYGQKADSMFRVPEDELAATGVAPL